MTVSDNANLVLRRCKTMNCVYAGQAFSIGALHAELGGRDATDATVKEMVEAQLISLGSNGTFVLSAAGADAIAALLPAPRRNAARSGAWQSKRASGPSA